MLEKRSDAAEMDTAVCSAIETRMLERLTDRSTHVRVQAVHALARLQDPSRPSDCRVIGALARALRADPHYDVRRAALQRVVVCRSTLSAILHRLNDANEQVRFTLHCVATL
jgi:condensin complex subunit 3